MEKINFYKDDVICYQGDDTDGLYILINGELEVLIADDIADDLKKNELIAVSRRVGVIKEPKTPFGEISFILNLPRSATIRALTNGVLVKIPTGKDALKNLLRTNPVIGLSISKTLLQKSLSTFGVIEDTIKLLEKAQMYYDNFSFVYYKLNQNAKDKTNPVYVNGKTLVEKSKGKVSDKLSLALIETNLSASFEKEYGIEIEIKNINLEAIDIIKNILYLPEKVAKIVIKLSPDIVEYACLKLSEYLQQLNDFFIKTNKLAEEELLRLAGSSSSIFESYYSIYGLLKTANHPSFKFVEKAHAKLVKILKDMHIQFLDMYNSKISNLHPEFLKQESQLLEKEKETVVQKQEAKKVKLIEQSNLIFDDNFNKLLDIDCSKNEIKAKLRETLDKYNKIVDKFDTMGDARKIKKELDAAYWPFYKDLFIRYIETGGELPNYAFIMLRYGILDDNLLSEETINCLKVTPIETPYTFPIYFADEWLEKIYNNEENPSINGLGQSYDEYIKENKIVLNDPAEGLVNYEINEVVAAAVRTCAGMISQQSPIIDSDYISLKPENCIVTKEKLENTIKEILQIDYSCFYREVRVMCGDTAEFVQKEVIPNFIILPVAGAKAVCWQEISGRNKGSRARIMVPLFATADLKEMLLTAFAQLRWELTKTIAGPNWGDPINGGMTGKYFEYTSVYKQSKELSEEIKEKIKKQFKKTAQTKDRFAEDYALWMQNESQGIMKLNVLTRDIFFNYAPFNKRIRDKLANNPNFSKLNFKFVNLNTKKITAIENKIKKYEKAGIEIPAEIRKELEFYKIGI